MKKRRSILLIDENTQPYRFITRRKALKLIALGRAHFHSDNILQVHYSILPYYRFYTGFSRFKIFLRDRGVCQYCGSSLKGRTIDHILPKSRGGIDNFENCVTACKECNQLKGNMTPEEAGMTLVKLPCQISFIEFLRNNDVS